MKKIKKFIRFCFIGAVWSFIYFGIVAWLMKWIWKFDIFGKRYWVKISRFWQDGGVIDTAQEYFFVIALIAIIPSWIWGWRKAMKVSIAKIIFFPVFWYHNYQEKKYAQLPKSITLKNMGAKVGAKQTPQQMLEEMISSRMPKQKDKKDLNSSKIRSSFEEKNKTFHEKVGK